ncbi:1-acyl-sn-glycerol-3-phosphate acyltransferase alpha isoform X2 [Agrilus planipennis]|nr:1-acyl-sn-glycerol-3-phosphate acyltransferase alpha isoform X2 [Agrilus planipennis]
MTILLLFWSFFLVLTIIIILWKNSLTAQYYLKFTLFILISLVAASLPIPLMLRRPRDSRNALLPAKLLRMFAWLFGLTYTVKGRENIVEDSGCVVLINHQSALDLIVLAQLWPIMKNCTVISKKEVFFLWPFGLATWLWGTIFIDRYNPERAQDAVNKTGETIRKRKARVLMFPEGTRNLGNKLLPFKKGAFHLALASQCPLQPVVVDRYKFLGKHTFGEGHIDITILPPIATSGLTKDDLPYLMETAYTSMSSHLKDSSLLLKVNNKKVN